MIKIAIPMAGLGTRMRPHTWSKARPLIALAGKTVLDYVLEQFDTLPDTLEREYIFIVSPNQLDQIQSHMQERYPEKKVDYAVQEVMRGQSDALYLAKEYIHGPLLISYSDTMIETNLSTTTSEEADALAWVRPVEDPRRFGVAQVNNEGWVSRLVEKPESMDNKLALVGFYYFKYGEKLVAAIEEQVRRNLTVKDEFFLVDAINILLENGTKMHTRPVDVWLDAGIPEALLETNRYLLTNRMDNSDANASLEGVTIIPPVYIHPSATIKSSVIGPYVSVGQNCEIDRVVISNSILEDNVYLAESLLTGSLLGRDVRVEGKAETLNLGDNAWMKK
ncbi:MAG TPA: sugar phosphate nucleotidyltransferase [Bellilinea sp.]|nr:sugar phosphate nucleotidyltransferase [Bellilinea sp.]